MAIGINVGCGKVSTALVPLSTVPVASTTWVQFDYHAWNVHVNGDARALPFRDSTFDVVHCSHLIEHIDEDDVGTVLAEFDRVLQRTGWLFIAAPDVPRAKEAGSEWWSVVGDVGARLPGWEHKWSCSIPRLRAHLEAAGFVATWARGVPNGNPPKTTGWPDDFEVRFLARPRGFRWSRYYPQAAESVAIKDTP